MRFRAGTWDAKIFREVCLCNEYGLPDSRSPVALRADDVVVDVGAHIGSFSFAAYQQGSRSVHAYEANADNFSLLKENMDGLSVTVHRVAVWRSDIRQSTLYFGPCVLPENTGGGTVFADKGELVPTVALDDIVNGLGRVKLLKLDCEGSEWPILFTSSCLDKVANIVGEYHEMSSIPSVARVDGYSFDAPTLRAFLESRGYACHTDGRRPIGKFWARR